MLLHICGRDDWRPGVVYLGDTLDTEGFIHCSDPGTVHLPANNFFAGRTDLLLLEIDPARLDVPVRWEPGDPANPSGVWFPHVYGPIPSEAVVATHEFPLPEDGSFTPPGPIASPER